MRRATHDTQWMMDGDTFVGVILGFDFCAEHEFGVGPLFQAMAMQETPGIGLESRKIGMTPNRLRFVEYKHKPRDRRRKAYPAALLYCIPGTGWRTDEELFQAARSETQFFSEPGDTWHNPKNDICCAWSDSDFAIQVRGEENIARLRELKDAFDRADIVASTPHVMGFFRNGGLAFGILGKFSAQTLQAVRERDEAAKRLSDALKATGIEQKARESGRPASIANAFWEDGQPDTLRLYLCPADRRKFDSAWLTVDEAKKWAEGASFLDKTPEMEAAKKDVIARWGTDWEHSIYSGLETAGIRLATLFRTALNDNGELVVRLWPVAECAHLLPFGEYPVADILNKYPARKAA